MQRNELIEWIVIIVSIIAWWPRIFWGYDAGWYHALIYYVVPLVLVIIFVRRYTRMKRGFEYSEQVVKSQQSPEKR